MFIPRVDDERATGNRSKEQEKREMNIGSNLTAVRNPRNRVRGNTSTSTSEETVQHYIASTTKLDQHLCDKNFDLE